MNTKKFKRAIELPTHWKTIHSIQKTTAPLAFPCQSKNDYLILTDPLGVRSRFVISKSSYYWLNESIRLMQHHGNAVLIGEIIEIERIIKALKTNVEKNGAEKTFFHRAEALINFLRLCSTIFEKPSERFYRRLQALFKLCAISWLYILDLILPVSIVRMEKNFLFDDDYGDFENDSIIRSFRKNDQEKIRKINQQIPNLRHLLYSIVLILDRCLEHNLFDRIYLERFQMIYEIWMLIDNELNHRQTRPNLSKRTSNKFTWNFLHECETYEQIFGILTSIST